MSTDEHRRRVVERIRQLEHEGRLTPDEVIGDAKDPSSPLHDEFTWDVNEAALEHWRDTARRIIRSVVYTVEIHNSQVTVPLYTHDPDRKQEQGYITVTKLLTEKDLAAKCLAQEFDRAASSASRALNYASVFGLQRDVRGLLSRIESLSQKLQKRGK